MATKCRYEILDIDSVLLDTTNPRIRQWIEIYGNNPTAEHLHLALGVGVNEGQSTSTTFQSLKESIRTNQGLINPIIVNRLQDGRQVVIEGNTRVAIYRGFLAEEAPGPWKTIPAMVYENLEQTGIDAIRLQAHLVGPRPWDAYSKAKYLHHLRTVELMPFELLVDLCGGRKRELQSYLGAYADMERHYRPIVESDSAFDPSRFSAFVEVQRPAIKAAIAKAGKSMDDFAAWVHERLLDRQENVRVLPNILGNPAALEVFLRNGAKAAIKLLDVPPPASSQSLALDEIARALTQRINQLPFRELEKLQQNPSLPSVQALFEAEDSIIELCKRIRGDTGD